MRVLDPCLSSDSPDRMRLVPRMRMATSRSCHKTGVRRRRRSDTQRSAAGLGSLGEGGGIRSQRFRVKISRGVFPLEGDGFGTAVLVRHDRWTGCGFKAWGDGTEREGRNRGWVGRFNDPPNSAHWLVRMIDDPRSVRGRGRGWLSSPLSVAIHPWQSPCL